MNKPKFTIHHNGIGSDWIIKNTDGVVVAVIYKNREGKGYFRMLRTRFGGFETAQYDSWFPTLRKAKEYFGII